MYNVVQENIIYFEKKNNNEKKKNLNKMRKHGILCWIPFIFYSVNMK